MDRKSQNEEAAKDLIGLRFGRLTIVHAKRGSNRKGHVVKAQCECGITRRLVLSQLFEGRYKSCGAAGCKGRHRMSRSTEYTIWASMIDRCCNPRNQSYARYGGRGIKVDPRWRESFEAFYCNVGPRPSPEYSLDRFPDNNGNYEPGNVRWATRCEQQNNTRTNRLVTACGLTLTVAEWSRRSGNVHVRNLGQTE